MRVWSFIFCLGFGLFGSFVSWGYGQQLFPDAGPVFRDDVVPRIDITIDKSFLDAIYEHPWSDEEYPVVFKFDNGDFSLVLDQVGFRCRGNTSRDAQKKSFKVSFNTFISGQKFFGLEKMNLNGEHNDPSVIRSKLCWDICRELNVPASRANHILLYINDIFWGVYINVEHIDEEFVKLRYGNNDGNLYKCLWPADLAYRGDDPDEYKFQNGDRRAYDLRTNQENENYSDIAHFIDVLNNTPVSDRAQELRKVFDIDSYLPAMVMDIFTANWDGPLYNKNNFYLYFNTDKGKFQYIPYDLDNTFGIDWFGIDWAQRDVYRWSPSSEERPLFEKIMEVPSFRERYTELFREFIVDYVRQGTLKDRAVILRNKIAGYISEDPFYSGDYGWDFGDFITSYSSSLSASHVPQGLFEYIDQRAGSALNQLDPSGVELWTVSQRKPLFFPNPATDHIRLSDPQPAVVTVYTLSGKKIRQWDNPIKPDLYFSPELSPGCYVIRIEPKSGNITSQRLIIN